jgi:hypothetical protein
MSSERDKPLQGQCPEADAFAPRNCSQLAMSGSVCGGPRVMGRFAPWAICLGAVPIMRYYPGLDTAYLGVRTGIVRA